MQQVKITTEIIQQSEEGAEERMKRKGQTLKMLKNARLIEIAFAKKEIRF